MSRKDKCPKCGCTETVTNSFTNDQGILEETWTKCKQCGRLAHHYAYGCTYVKDWKDATYPPLKYQIKNLIKRLLSRKRKGNNNDDLPF